MNAAVPARTHAQEHETGTVVLRAAAPVAKPVSPLQRLGQAVGNTEFGRFVQAKLTVGHPGDKFELEADQVADQVMRMPDPAGKASAAGEDAGVRIQRRCSECEEEMQKQEIVEGLPPEVEEEEEVLRGKESSGPLAAGPKLESGFNAIRGGGEPLTAPVRDFFEPRFGYDFSGVRLHKDNAATELARDARALAFTVGRDLVFGAGQFAPETESGRHLLAHELTHVVQQSERGSDSSVRKKPKPATAAKPDFGFL
jgi:hypothetical protein